MTDEHDGCGIYWLWQVVCEEMKPACARHDAYYEQRAAGLPTPTLDEVDRIFLDDMLAIAGSSWKLRAKAYFYYSLARAWGLTVRRKLWREGG